MFNKSNRVEEKANTLMDNCNSLAKKVMVCAEMVYVRNLCRGVYFTDHDVNLAEQEINASKRRLKAAMEDYAKAVNTYNDYLNTFPRQLYNFPEMPSPHDLVAKSIKKVLDK